MLSGDCSKQLGNMASDCSSTGPVTTKSELALRLLLSPRPTGHLPHSGRSAGVIIAFPRCLAVPLMRRVSAHWLMLAVLIHSAANADERPQFSRGEFPVHPSAPTWHQERLQLTRPQFVRPERPTTEQPRRPMSVDIGPAAEFDRQQTIVMAWRSDAPDAALVQMDVAREAAPHVTIAMIVPPDEDLDTIRQQFKKADVDLEDVIFVRLPVDSVWVRDYGPFVIRRQHGRTQIVDAEYDSVGRPADDDFPTVFAEQLGLTAESSGLVVEGGNLLTNGRGLLVTTTKTVADNQHMGYSMYEMQTKLLDEWNARELVILEPLAGEPTAHVDMFATFVDEQTIVVASIDPKVDRFNSRLLDQAARRLAECRTESGPLKVERIPMPHQWDASKWPSYTNVVFANGVLLVPYYIHQDDRWQQAADTYARLLPGWKILGVDCTDVIGMGGALHCLTLNIPDLRMMTDQPRPKHQLLARYRQSSSSIGMAP